MRVGGAEWRGLPDEFSPPTAAAAAIAKLRTLEERELYFGRIPRVWHAFIADLAVIGIAAEIVKMPGLQLRQRALAEVPQEWQADVRQHVRRLWEYREKFGDLPS